MFKVQEKPELMISEIISQATGTVISDLFPVRSTAFPDLHPGTKRKNTEPETLKLSDSWASVVEIDVIYHDSSLNRRRMKRDRDYP